MAPFRSRLIVQAVTWYLRYPLSYRDLEEMFLERGFEVDHSTRQSLGPRLCTCHRETAAPVPQTALWLSPS